jgi:hypothetical protein
MGGKIPQPVRLEVLRKWLQGYSRDEIAKDTRIGAGTVSGIIQQCRQDDLDFDLLRGVAVELRNRGMGVENFAPLLRLKSSLEEKEVLLEISQNDNLFTEYKKFEQIIITIEVLCFKHGMPVDQFFERVRDQSSLADNLGISIEALPSYLVHLKRNIENQKEEIHRLQLETENEVQRRGSTMNLLREYQANKPLIESTKNGLGKLTQERDLCRIELHKVKELYQQNVWKQKEEEYSWKADPEEIKKAELELSSGFEGDHYVSMLREPVLKNIILDLYRYPGKYVEAIRKVIDTYDSLHRQSR